MGHAGAIVSGGKGTAQGKMDALRAAGAKVGLNPTEAGELMVEVVRASSLWPWAGGSPDVEHPAAAGSRGAAVTAPAARAAAAADPPAVVAPVRRRPRRCRSSPAAGGRVGAVMAAAVAGVGSSP